jgi:hypothetical protein
MFLLALFALCAGGSFVLWARWESVRLAIASVRYRSETPSVSVYAVLAQGRSVLPSVDRVTPRDRDAS